MKKCLAGKKRCELYGSINKAILKDLCGLCGLVETHKNVLPQYTNRTIVNYRRVRGGIKAIKKRKRRYEHAGGSVVDIGL